MILLENRETNSNYISEMSLIPEEMFFPTWVRKKCQSMQDPREDAHVVNAERETK